MSVIIPETARPTNLQFARDVNVTLLDSDVFGICDRIKEIDRRLFIVVANRGDEYAFVIMEHCEDGVDRMVFKVKELDARLLSRLRKIMDQPLSARMVELERQEHKLKEEANQEASDELYERLGAPMWTELDRCGFIDGGRGVSYPKKGVAQAKRLRGEQ